MIRTIVFLLLGGLVVYGGLQLAAIPGDVAFDWQGWQVRMPAPVLILALFLFAGLAALIYRFWRGVRGVPGAVISAHRRARRERGYRALTQGMVAVAAGDANEARRQAKRADVLLNEPPLTMLLSAQTAQLNGDEDAAKRYFTAMLEREETAFLGLRGLLMQAQREGNQEEALRLAQRAHRLQPKTPWVLNTLYGLQISEQSWDEASKSLDGLAKLKALPEADVSRRRAALNLLQSARAADEGDTRKSSALACDAQRLAPGWRPAIMASASAMIADGKHRSAAKLIEKSWGTSAHPDMIGIYRAAVKSDDTVKFVQRVEKLVASNRADPESQAALARVMLEAELWGGALTHLESVGEANMTASACRLMARLEEGEKGDIDAANRWLRRAADAPPDSTWHCAECGGESGGFKPVCGQCGALGTLDWETATRVAPMAISGEDTDSPADSALVELPHEATDAPEDAPPALKSGAPGG